MRLLSNRLFCNCLLALLAAPAGAQPPAAKSQPPTTAAQPSAAEVTRLATALRASTRTDPANHIPAVELLKEFLVSPHTGPVDGAVVGVEVINQAKGGA